MSHFSLYVIGNHQQLEAQLQPFHEFECTGDDDQYVVDTDVTESEMEEWENSTKDDPSEDSFDEYLLREEYTIFAGKDLVIKNGDTKYRYAYKDEKGSTIVIRRTNPNAKWDWWQIGGRFSTRLLLKNGETSRQAKRGDIDFETQLERYRVRAGVDWDTIRGLAPVSLWSPMKSFGDDYPSYWKQPAIVHIKGTPSPMRESLIFIRPDEIDTFLLDREAHATQEAYACTSPYAFLRDGEWSAKGEMGWWGMSRDIEDVAAWKKATYEMLLGLPADTMITVVDCHI